MNIQIKNQIQKVILLIGIISFCSCGEDFLTQYPKNKVVDVNFYKTNADFEAAANGIYDAYVWYQRGEFFPMQDITTTFANSGGGRYSVYKYGAFGVNSTWNMAAQWWELHYLAIFRANVLLANADTPNSEVSEAIRNRVKGEALFLRAYSYFHLTYLYGDVPLILAPQEYDDLLVTRTPKADVVNQIIADLKQAEELLPSVKTYRNTSNLGRASRGAAKSLLGKTYVYEKRWKEASDKLMEVIQSGDYELEPVFSDMFWPTGENGIESIFEHQYEVDDPDANASWFAVACGFTNESNSGWVNGWDYLNPTQYYTDQFETIAGYTVSSTFLKRENSSPYPTFVYDYSSKDPAFKGSDPLNNRDPRLKWTVWYEDTPYIEEFEERTGQSNVNYKARYSKESNYNTVKYLNGRFDKQNNSSMNIISIRYADVLLLYAEAQIQQNNLTEAIKYINEVRKRPSVNMPTVEEVASIQGINLTTDQQALMKYLQKERYRELAFEYGHLYYDQVRWDVFADEQVKYWTANKEGFNNPALSSFSKNYYLFPIPNSEIVINPNLSQNPGY